MPYVHCYVEFPIDFWRLLRILSQSNLKIFDFVYRKELHYPSGKQEMDFVTDASVEDVETAARSVVDPHIYAIADSSHEDKYDMGEPAWVECDCAAMNLMLDLAADLHPLRCVSKRMAATPLSQLKYPEWFDGQVNVQGLAVEGETLIKELVEVVCGR